MDIRLRLFDFIVFFEVPIGHYMIDRMLFMFVYRRKFKNVQSIYLDETYSIILFPLDPESDRGIEHTCGDQYFYSCNEKFSFFSFTHPYTSFLYETL